MLPKINDTNTKKAKPIINALVLGVGGNVSQGIIKALRETRLPIRTLGACVGEYSKGLYMCDEGYICPYAADNGFIPWVIEFCNKNDVDIIFTGVEENIIELAKYKSLLQEKTKTVFISSSYEKLLIGQDKYLTCKFLEESGCNYPKYQLWNSVEEAIVFANKVGYPLIAKPRNGKSSRGVLVLHSKEDILNHDDLNNYILQQYIGDEESEYTIGCYIDKNGNLQKLLPMRRKLYAGTTIWAETVQNNIICEECTRICEAFKPCGPLNIQMRLDKNGMPICFELNVRFSGTTAIRSHFGFQDIKAMILEYIWNENISECFNLKSGEVFRYDNELYLMENTTNEMKDNGYIKNISQHVLYDGE